MIAAGRYSDDVVKGNRPILSLWLQDLIQALRPSEAPLIRPKVKFTQKKLWPAPSIGSRSETKKFSHDFS